MPDDGSPLTATVSFRRILPPLLLALALALIAVALPSTARVDERLGLWSAQSDTAPPDGAEQMAQQDWPELDELALLAAAGPEDLDLPPVRAARAAFLPAAAAAALPVAHAAALRGPRFPTGPPPTA